LQVGRFRRGMERCRKAGQHGALLVVEVDREPRRGLQSVMTRRPSGQPRRTAEMGGLPSFAGARAKAGVAPKAAVAKPRMSKGLTKRSFGAGDGPDICRGRPLRYLRGRPRYLRGRHQSSFGCAEAVGCRSDRQRIRAAAALPRAVGTTITKTSNASARPPRGASPEASVS
jgi:hypothetical protein